MVSIYYSIFLFLTEIYAICPKTLNTIINIGQIIFSDLLNLVDFTISIIAIVRNPRRKIKEITSKTSDNDLFPFIKI
jgi:hypothetical protein